MEMMELTTMTIPPDVTNSSNTSSMTEAAACPEGLFEDTANAVFVPIVFSAIFIIGIIGNGLLVWIVYRNKSMHNTPNILIVSLAIGDIILLIFSVPFKATIYTFKSYPYGTAVCKLATFSAL